MRYQGRSFNIIWPIIALNFVLFIATLVNQDLILLLGLQPASLPARPWTLVTNLFIHASIWHILANMITLYFFGSNLSHLFRWPRLLLTYFGAGILGNLFYILLAPPDSVAVGASGAIFGLGGALTVIMPRMKVFIFPIPVPLPLWVAVIGGFLILSIPSLFPDVAWQAHLGGLVFGLVMGYLFKRRGRYLL